MTGRIDTVRTDMPRENAQHQKAEQQHRQADSNRQCLGRTLTLAFVLNQKYHAAGETDNDCDKRCNYKNLDQHFLFQAGVSVV